MHSLTNTDNVSSGTTLLALSLIATFSLYYLYRDRRFTLSERLYYLICKRNIQEALLEHELLALRKNQLHMSSIYSNSHVYIAEPEIITENTQFVEINGHKLRIVHIIHELGSKVPLIVFIHGLGGQVNL
jgi:hypothetical protein